MTDEKTASIDSAGRIFGDESFEDLGLTRGKLYITMFDTPENRKLQQELLNKYFYNEKN